VLGPKMAQDGPKTAQDSPRRPQDGPKRSLVQHEFLLLHNRYVNAFSMSSNALN
jgi:hypothetical protein